MAAEQVYQNAPCHVMLLTPTVMTRAWCLWELAVRKSARKYTIPILSKQPRFARDLLSSGKFLEDMRASNQEDLRVIRGKIQSTFGDSFDFEMTAVFRACGGNIDVRSRSPRKKRYYCPREILLICT